MKYVWRIWGPVLGFMAAIFGAIWVFMLVFGHWGALVFFGIFAAGILVWITAMGVSDMKRVDRMRNERSGS
jgi:hypothetical protein